MPEQESSSELHELPISIGHAGLVILQVFIERYFERLGLIENGGFVDTNAQCEAVLFFNYMATCDFYTEEQHLVLNKLLCGLAVTSAVEPGMDTNGESEEIANSLIEAMIQYWSAIGSSSIDGFRGNWLVRQGSMRELADHWELIVETKPYDLLLQQAPVSYSIIKHPWMPKPIQVSWPT